MSQMSSRESESYLQSPLDQFRRLTTTWTHLKAGRACGHITPIVGALNMTIVVIGGSDLIGTMDSKTLTGQSQ